MSLHVLPIKTKIFRRSDRLNDFLIDHLRDLSLEKKILVVTSKIVSLAEDRLISQNEVIKEELIKSEADFYLGEVSRGCHLTIKHNLLVMTAGIDLSNSEDNDFILLPKNPFESARKIHQSLKERFNLNEFGVLISDSRTTPLRLGVLGCGLACFGFRPIKNMVGENDLFNQKLKMTQLNLIDALAGSAVMMMGEANEQTPLALIDGAPVEFTDRNLLSELSVETSEDLYSILYRDLIKNQNLKEKK